MQLCSMQLCSASEETALRSRSNEYQVLSDARVYYKYKRSTWNMDKRGQSCAKLRANFDLFVVQLSSSLQVQPNLVRGGVIIKKQENLGQSPK